MKAYTCHRFYLSGLSNPFPPFFSLTCKNRSFPSLSNARPKKCLHFIHVIQFKEKTRKGNESEKLTRCWSDGIIRSSLEARRA